MNLNIFNYSQEIRENKILSSFESNKAQACTDYRSGLGSWEVHPIS